MLPARALFAEITGSREPVFWRYENRPLARLLSQFASQARRAKQSLTQLLFDLSVCGLIDFEVKPHCADKNIIRLSCDLSQLKANVYAFGQQAEIRNGCIEISQTRV